MSDDSLFSVESDSSDDDADLHMEIPIPLEEPVVPQSCRGSSSLDG